MTGHPKPRALLFDHDGVLVTSERLHFLAWQRLFRDLGLPWNEISFHGLVGRTAPEILKILLDRFRPGWEHSEFDLEKLALRKNDYYLQSVKTQLAVYPGVKEGLEWAESAGIPCAVVSNARRRELDASLDLLGLRDFFEIVISRDDVPRPKPDPGPFLYAAACLGIDARECIAIDDSPTGLEGALLAGCITASITSNYLPNQLEIPVSGRPDLRPVKVVATMDEFFEWVRTLVSG